MSSMIEVLPLEIIIFIIDQVAKSTDDECFTDLKACSLTCTTLLPLCRIHIFHSVTPDLRPGETTLLSSFTQLVESSPRAIEYIRELKLSPIDYNYGLSSAEQSTLGKLRMLHTLTVESRTIFGLDWKVLNPATQSTLLRLIQLPTIVNLRLLTFRHFIPFHLIQCTGLKHLVLHNFCRPNFDDVNPFAQSYEFLRLDGIELDCYTVQDSALMLRSTTQYPKPIIDLGALKSIMFRINDRPESALEVFKYANHLETVHFKLGAITDSSEIVPCVLPSLNTLTSLTIGLNFESSHVLSPICSELKKLAGRNHITTLVIGLVIMASSDPPEDDWNLLEKTLFTDGWSSLQRFDLNIRIVTWKPVSWELPHCVYEEYFDNVHATHLAGLATTKFFKYNFNITRGPWSLQM